MRRDDLLGPFEVASEGVATSAAWAGWLSSPDSTSAEGLFLLRCGIVGLAVAI